jgi:hypothetical protein
MEYKTPHSAVTNMQRGNNNKHQQQTSNSRIIVECTPKTSYKQTHPTKHVDEVTGTNIDDTTTCS